MIESEQKEKTKKLLQYFNKRIKTEPNDVALYVFRSTCYEELENYELALADALTIINLDQSYWKGHHQALNIRIKMGTAAEEKIPECFTTKESFKDLMEKRDLMKMTRLQRISFENEASLQVASPTTVTEKTSSNSGRYGKKEENYRPAPNSTPKFETDSHQSIARSRNVQSTSKPPATSWSNKNKKGSSNKWCQ